MMLLSSLKDCTWWGPNYTNLPFGGLIYQNNPSKHLEMKTNKNKNVQQFFQGVLRIIHDKHTWWLPKGFNSICERRRISNLDIRFISAVVVFMNSTDAFFQYVETEAPSSLL